MKQLKALACFAAEKTIRGRSFKRNSLLKPLDIILEQVEQCPRWDDENERLFVRASSEGLIRDHLERANPYARKVAIPEYVRLFFDGVMEGAHYNNASFLLQRERALRSAYLVYVRERLAEIRVEKGKARDVTTAQALLARAEQEDEVDEDLANDLIDDAAQS